MSNQLFPIIIIVSVHLNTIFISYKLSISALLEFHNFECDFTIWKNKRVLVFIKRFVSRKLIVFKAKRILPVEIRRRRGIESGFCCQQ